MFRWITPIYTQQRHASMFAIIAINLLWFCALFQVFVNVNALVFTIRRFTEDAQLIGWAMSINYIFAFLLGPACNYLSDRIWTKIGRRKPFIILGWTATAIAMAIIPFMPTYGSLIVVIFAYNLLGDMATPLEPLCMEVVPPHQRGRSMAVRQIMVQAAALFYFQILFPRFDDVLSFPSWVPFLNQVTFTGEQLIYILCSLFYFGMVVFLLLFVREVKDTSSENIALKDLQFKPIKATRDFLWGTFGDKRWWWIYLIYCAVAAAGSAWSSFQPLMLTEEFKYSKANIASIGLPSMIYGIFLVMPLLGWFTDRRPKISYLLLVGSLVACSAIVFVLFGIEFDLNDTHLPSTPILFGLALFVTLGVCAFFLIAAQLLLRWAGDAGARVWIFGLSLCLQILHALICWSVTWHHQSDGETGPTMITWFLLEQLRSTLRSCTDVLTGPMFFDFVPRDRMGTLSSGFGFTNNVQVFFLANLAGYWVQIHSTGTHNSYSSLFGLQIAISIASLGATLLFLRMFQRGKIREYGRLGLNADGTEQPLDPNSAA